MQAVWVEIPVLDIERALKFYVQVFNVEATPIRDEAIRRSTTLVNTSPEGNPGISLTQTAGFEPSDRGPLVYIDAGKDVTPFFDKITSAGGQIVAPKTSMGEMGDFALFKDTEGNLLALYSYGG